MYCEECGAEIKPGSRFCEACGAEQASQPVSAPGGTARAPARPPASASAGGQVRSPYPRQRHPAYAGRPAAGARRPLSSFLSSKVLIGAGIGLAALIVLIVVLVLVTGGGGALSGIYENSSGDTFSFSKDGTFSWEANAYGYGTLSLTGSYKVTGDKIHFSFGDDAPDWTRQTGTIDGDSIVFAGETFKKK